mmetsp:Transcript_28533/g.66889  ORF Transcript_28533/g.66889 Transcript_28533/m.66889 type:complete len:532 (-) Transcript_28533:85-1680(-)
MFAHSAGPSAPVDAVFVSDLDALRVTGELRRHPVACSGSFPLATSGSQMATVRRGVGHATFWFVGGKDTGGRLNDVFAFDSLFGAWTAVHCSALGVSAQGDAMSKREGHSVVALLDGLWIFGGRSGVGVESDLHCLDTAGEQPEWKLPQTQGTLPTPRELHTAVLLEPTGYMLLVGGLDESGGLHKEVSILSLYGLQWSKLDQGMIPLHTVSCACVRGELFTFGGSDANDRAHEAMQVFDLTSFSQRACLELNAETTEYVAVKGQGASMGSLRNQFTVEAWVLARSFPPYATIVSKADMGWKTGFGLAKYGAGKGDVEEVPTVNFFLTPGYATTKVQATIEPHTWTHVAGTYDGQHLKLLINGVVHDTLEFKAEKEEEIDALHFQKADFCIGAHPNKAAWDGLIDEVRLWNVARTDQQVRECMHAPLLGITPGLLGQWSFNEGAGTLVVDSSGQRNHGTIEGTIARHLSTRMDKGQRAPNALERRAEDVSGAFRTWESAFQLTHGRSPTKSDILLTGNPVAALARQLGLFN